MATDKYIYVVVFCVFLTLLTTGCVMAPAVTSNWELVTYSREVLYEMTNSSVGPDGYIFVTIAEETKNMFVIKETRMDENDTIVNSTSFVFLINMAGGLWKICDTLTDQEREAANIHYGLYDDGRLPCYMYHEHWSPSQVPHQYLSEDVLFSYKRFQTSTISSMVVCLMLVSACVVMGCLAIVYKQVLCMMMTGSMYMLAGAFLGFSLMTFRGKLKAQQTLKHGEGFFTPTQYLLARSCSTGWPVAMLNWATGCCIITSLAWMLLYHIGRNVKIKHGVTNDAETPQENGAPPEIILTSRESGTRQDRYATTQMNN